MTFPFAACLLGLVLAVILLPALPLGSKVQPLFLIAWALAVVLLMAKGYTWGELMDAAALGSQKAFSPILFLLCAGAMIGTWNACGTIPMLTLFGISHMSAGLFLVLAFAGCFIFGIVTGTVFGVCGLRILWLLTVVPRTNTILAVEASYPITWTLSSVLFVLYYLRGGWMPRCIAAQEAAQQTGAAR